MFSLRYVQPTGCPFLLQLSWLGVFTCNILRSWCCTWMFVGCNTHHNNNTRECLCQVVGRGSWDHGNYLFTHVDGHYWRLLVNFFLKEKSPPHNIDMAVKRITMEDKRVRTWGELPLGRDCSCNSLIEILSNSDILTGIRSVHSLPAPTNNNYHCNSPEYLVLSICAFGLAFEIYDPSYNLSRRVIPRQVGQPEF